MGKAKERNIMETMGDEPIKGTLHISPVIKKCFQIHNMISVKQRQGGMAGEMTSLNPWDAKTGLCGRQSNTGLWFTWKFSCPRVAEAWASLLETGDNLAVARR